MKRSRRQVGEKWRPDPQAIRRQREQAQLWRLTDAWKDANHEVKAIFMSRFNLRQVEEPADPTGTPA
jgi:hypothetical protein